METSETNHSNSNIISVHNGIFTVQSATNQLIGSGSYGKVYSGKHHLPTRDEDVAIKMHTDAFLLKREVKIYQYLWKYKKQGYAPQLNIPHMIWSGPCDTQKHETIVMERLGISLDHLFDSSNKSWSPETVCWIGARALELLRGLHTLGIIHRDIKPDNFALGYQGAQRLRLYIFDFGLSSQFIDTNGKHNPIKTGLSLIGTMRYASVNNHLGTLQSRRDDLEALFYVLFYFYNGSLEWKHISHEVEDRDQRNKLILEYKKKISEDDVPPILRGFYTYVKQLSYDEEPDYKKWELWFSRASKDTSQLPDWSYYYANTPTQHIFPRGVRTIKKHLTTTETSGVSVDTTTTAA